MVDWKECELKRMVKDISVDLNKMNSLLKIAEEKVEAADSLAETMHYAKISLVYDALRSYLEYAALKKGFKIYNHECYVAFLKEILSESGLGDEFDKFRRIRNGINYYGKEVDSNEGKEIVKEMKELIVKIKNKLI